MAHPWLRLWNDMANDPKWRTIARKSGQKIGDVVAVYVHMLTCGSNAEDRGHIEGWCDEDVATALDIDTEQVEAIREAMQGRVLDGDYLAGWEKRQPKREREDDNSTERSRQSRQRQKEPKEQVQRHATPCNANDSQETPRLDEIRIEEIRQEEPKAKTKASAAPKYSPLDDLVSSGVDPQVASDWLKVRKTKKSESTKTGIDGVLQKIADAGMTADQGIRICCERGWAGFNSAWIENSQQQARASPSAKPEKFDPTAYVNRQKTNPKENKNERTIEFNEFGEPV